MTTDDEAAELDAPGTEVEVWGVGSASFVGAGPSMKWMYMKGPATAKTAMNTTGPLIHQMSLRRLRMTIGCTFRTEPTLQGRRENRSAAT